VVVFVPVRTNAVRTSHLRKTAAHPAGTRKQAVAASKRKKARR
jgi:hypothetical protein